MSAEAGAAAGSALVKYVGLPVIIGAVTAALGFLILPPKTHKEFVGRLVATIMCSAIFGPWLYFWFLAHFPEVLATAVEQSGLTKGYVVMMLSAPFLVIGGLPGWWVLGAAVRWFDKRKDKDLVELAGDAKAAAKDFLP